MSYPTSSPTSAKQPDPTPEAGSVTMFTTSWCGFCVRLKGQLSREGVSFTEIDLDIHPEHVDFVERVNHGNRTVPTVVFPDGSAATNPSAAQVRDRLAGLADRTG